MKVVKHKTPELQPTPAAFSQKIHQKKSVEQDPDDIIDLTLDSSDTEQTPNEPFIPGFSMGSTILNPTLILVKEPHDKPRSFVHYTLDFEAGLANISAHGFIDKVSMGPRW